MMQFQTEAKGFIDPEEMAAAGTMETRR